MDRKRIRRTGRISLAVAAIRDLEKVLITASRKRKLTADDRQKLVKCAAYLKRKRKKSIAGNKVLLAWRVWIQILRFLAKVVVSAEKAKKIFDGLMGGK